MESTSPRRYVAGLDGVRALAVAGVLAFHLGYLPGGYLGVDAFFVVSGFLITRLLVDEWAQNGAIVLGRFWFRRVRRLVPALLVVLGLVAVLAPFLSPDIAGRVRSDGFAALEYWANWHAIATGGYFSRLAAPSPLEHLWSLAVEEQFYVLWPLLIVAILWLVKGSLRSLCACIAGMAVVSYAWMALAYDPLGDPTRLYEGTDTRAGALLLGAGIAVGLAVYAARYRPRHLIKKEYPQGPWIARLGVAASVVWLGVAWSTISGTSAFLYRGGLALCGVAVGVVILACLGDGLLSRALSWRPLRFLGERSYGVYLAHWPVFVWLDHSHTGMSGLSLNVVRLVIVAGLACLSYALVEQPIRRGSLPHWRGIVALPAAVASVVAALVIAASTAGPGYAAVPSSASAVLDRSANPANSHATGVRVAASVPGAFATAGSGLQGSGAAILRRLVPQRQPSAAAPLRILVLGDSFAVQSAPAIRAELESTGSATVLSGAFVGTGLGADTYHWHSRWPAILREEHPDVVIVSLGIWDREYAAKDPTAYGALVDEAIGDILAVGANVVWIEQAAAGPPPERPGTTVFPTASRDYVEREYEALPQRFPGRVTWVATTPTFEPTGVYTAFLPGVSGRLERVRMPDNFHLCPAGAVLVAELALRALQPYRLPAPNSSWATGGDWWQGRNYGATMGGGGCTRPDGAP